MGTSGLTFNHIGISTCNLENSMEFYQKVFGAQRLSGPTLLEGTDDAVRERAQAVFGSQWEKMRVAHLMTEDGIGIELFEFIIPQQKKPQENLPYWESGIFHFAFTTSDMEKTLAQIKKYGGCVRTDCFTLSSGCQFVYVEDPDGTVFELYSIPYQKAQGKGGMKG